MKNITSFDRATIKALHQKLNEKLNKALIEFEKENGLESHKFGNISFSGSEFTMKITLSACGNSKEKEKETNHFLSLYGLKIGMRVIAAGGMLAKIVGFEPHRHKYNIIIEGEKTGKKYVTDRDSIEKILEN